MPAKKTAAKKTPQTAASGDGQSKPTLAEVRDAELARKATERKEREAQAPMPALVPEPGETLAEFRARLGEDS